MHLCAIAPMHYCTQCTNAPLHQCTNSTNSTTCTNAPQGGATGCVEALLAARAKTTLMTSAGYSCLWIAAREGKA